MKKLFFLFLFFCGCSFCFSQTFIREIVPDSGSLILGHTKGVTYLNGEVLLAIENGTWPSLTMCIKLNASGDTLWTRYIDSVKVFNIYNNKGMISSTFDGGCIILGNDWGGSSFFRLTRLDSLGNQLWSKDFKNPITDFDTMVGVVQTKDSGFAFMGKTSIPFTSYGFSFIKLNSSGDTIWTRKYLTMDEQIIDFAEAPDSGFYFVGSGYFGTNYCSATLTKTNKEGDVIWRRKYSLAAGGISFLEIQTIRNDTILIETGPIPYSYKNGLAELTTSGTFLNATLLDSTLYSFATFLCKDGRILVVHGSNLLSLDSQMNIQWRRYYSVDSWVYGGLMGVFERDDGNNWVFGNYETGIICGAFLISVDSLGNAPCYTYSYPTVVTPRTLAIDTIQAWQEEKYPFSINSSFLLHSSRVTVTELCNVSKNEINESENVLLYPNPVSSQFTVSSYQFPIEHIEIYNSIGERIAPKIMSNDSKMKLIDVSNLNPGIYFVKVLTVNGISVQKLIVD